jgi:3-keto-5-aminohexanoate cleavage enzyme
MNRGPVIIEAAINGSTTKDTNPHVPTTPDEIAADARACLEAGAAIVHNHAAVQGEPIEIAESYLAGWRPVLAERPDALIYPTLAFGDGKVHVRHLAVLAERGALRIGICDPGSVNLGRSEDGIPVGAFVYANSFDDIAEILELHHDQRLGPSFAIYEPGFLRTALAWWRAGRLPAGSMFKFYLSTERGLIGAPFGLPPTAQALDMYVAMLGDCPVPWAVSVAGGDVVASGLAEHAIELGGHVHLGLEFHHGDRTSTNVELVAEAVALCERKGVEVATCDAAAEILGLPRAGHLSI